MNEEVKHERGITLIALVVTIVVLLILAGVSISLILDNNGIIQESKEAKIETRASQVEDEVGIWKQNNFINLETNKPIENADDLLQNLLDKKLITEDEIDRVNELITIKRKDKTVVKEISYENVKKYEIAKGYYTDSVALRQKGTNNEYTTFQKAYIMYNDEKIDISSTIQQDEYNYNYLPGYYIAQYLEEIGKVDNGDNLRYTDQTIIIEKDGIQYKGIINMGSFK